MSKPLQKKRSCIEHITQTKMDLGSRFERHVSVEEQSLESRRRANAMQKKTYTNWISKVHHLHIDDLYTDLRDGELLLQLLETVSGEKIPVRSRKAMPGSEIFAGLDRIQLALNFLSQQNVRLENIHPHDIQQGKEKETLALIWAIILRYQIVVVPEHDPYPVGSNRQPLKADPQEDTKQVPVAEPKEQTATRALLQWCQKTTQGYPGVKVTDFTTSWTDGLAFNAIIHKHRVDLIDFDSLQPENIVDNLNNAFGVAEKELGIPKLLDTEDMVFPDQRSIVVYISLYYSYFCLEHHKRAAVPPIREQLHMSEDESQVSRQKVKPVVTVPAAPVTVTEPSVVATQALTTSTKTTTKAGRKSANTQASSRPKTQTTRASTQKDLSASPNPPHPDPPSHPPHPGPPQYPPQSGPPPHPGPPPKPDPSTPPYPPPSYYAHYPTYSQPYHQYPYQQQPYQQQPHYQQPYQQQPYYQQPYQQQPYRPAYNQQPSYYPPPMQMQQQSLIQVQTGLGMLTVGGQQGLGAGANQSSFVKLGSTAIGAAPCSQPVKAASSAPTKKKGKKKKS